MWVQWSGQCPDLPSRAAKYGRDDLAPQLRCQKSVLAAIDNGWTPAVPLDRGLHTLHVDSKCLETAEDAESNTDVESTMQGRVPVMQVTVQAQAAMIALCVRVRWQIWGRKMQFGCNPRAKSPHGMWSLGFTPCQHSGCKRDGPCA